MPKPNDEVDVALLHALDINAVDFLVTQDQGIIPVPGGITGPWQSDPFGSDAVVWFRAAFESLQVRLPLVEEVPAHAVPLSDEIFDSLREGYSGFDNGGASNALLSIGHAGSFRLAGKLPGWWFGKRKRTRKPERGTGPKILKVCTFKVKPKFRGEKLGELSTQADPLVCPAECV